MIRYTLRCEKDHAFESWFQNSAAYDKQKKRGLVSCPICGDRKIEKLDIRLERGAPLQNEQQVRNALNPTAENVSEAWSHFQPLGVTPPLLRP